MTHQLDLFAAAPIPARRPPKADTALLLAMSDDHTTARAAPAATPIAAMAERWRAERGDEIDREQEIAEAEAKAEQAEARASERFTCCDCKRDFTGGGRPVAESEALRCHFCDDALNACPIAAERFDKIADTYCADTIAMHGKTRRTFAENGMEVVCVGSLRGNGRETIKVYELKPDDGTALGYHQRRAEDRRNDPLGFYHGMAVKAGGRSMMLVGPEMRFQRMPDRQTGLAL